MRHPLTSAIRMLLAGLCILALPVSTRSVELEPDRGVWRAAAPAPTKRTEVASIYAARQDLRRRRIGAALLRQSDGSCDYQAAMEDFVVGSEGSVLSHMFRA